MSDVVSFRGSLAGVGDRSSASGLRPLVLRDFTDPASPALWETWAQLERTGHCTAFQSSTFLRPLLEGVGRIAQSEFHVCVISDENGPLVGLPFVWRRKGTVSVLELADYGLCDYCAPLLADRFDPADTTLWKSFWRNVVRQLPVADILRVEKAPSHIGEWLNPMTRMREARPMDRATRQVPVGPAWLKTSIAKDGASRRRKLEREGETSFEVVGDERRVDDLMAKMLLMRRCRFQARGIQDSLEAPGVFEFYNRLLRAGCKDGSAVLGILSHKSEPIAMSAGLIWRGRFNGVLTAMNEEFGRFSPGLVSMTAMVEWCLKKQIAVHDLGLGEQHYKSRFGGDQTMLFEITQAQTPAGLIWKIVHDARTFLKNTVTSYPTLAARLQLMRGKQTFSSPPEPGPLPEVPAQPR